MRHIESLRECLRVPANGRRALASIAVVLASLTLASCIEPQATQTSSPRATSTALPSATSSPSVTASPTETATATATQTETPTATVTTTPTASPTPDPLTVVVDAGPLDVVQGHTHVIRVTVSRPATVTGELPAYPIRFAPLSDTEYIAFLGAHAMAAVGSEPMTVTVRSLDGQQTTLVLGAVDRGRRLWP